MNITPRKIFSKTPFFINWPKKSQVVNMQKWVYIHTRFSNMTRLCTKNQTAGVSQLYLFSLIPMIDDWFLMAAHKGFSSINIWQH